MSGYATTGYNKFVSPAEAERYRRVAAHVGDVAISGEVTDEGGHIYISRTSLDGSGLTDFNTALSDLRLFPAVAADPANLPSVAELSPHQAGAELIGKA